MIEGFVYRDSLVRLLPEELHTSETLWIDCKEPSDEDIHRITALAKLHPLTVEDIKSKETRIKYEEFGHYTLIVHKVCEEHRYHHSDDVIFFIIGDRMLITIHKYEVETINSLKINGDKLSSLVQKGVDYILHAILDHEIDLYFPLVERLYDTIGKIDVSIYRNPTEQNINKMFKEKRKVIDLKKTINPTLDVVSRLTKPSDNFIRNELNLYFRDVHDHVARINDILTNCNDQIATTVNERLSISSSKMNQVMQTLTVVATIMMTLTMITGFYGMNIPLPGGNDQISFWFFIGFFIILSVIMIAIFKKMNWL